MVYPQDESHTLTKAYLAGVAFHRQYAESVLQACKTEARTRFRISIRRFTSGNRQPQVSNENLCINPKGNQRYRPFDSKWTAYLYPDGTSRVTYNAIWRRKRLPHRPYRVHYSQVALRSFYTLLIRYDQPFIPLQ